MSITNRQISTLFTGKYEQIAGSENDYHSTPRPFFSLGYIISGSADFISGKTVTHVESGDVIFIPYRSLYVSKWYGKPSTVFLSLHFNFKDFGILEGNKEYPVQKVSGLKDLLSDFNFIHKNLSEDKNCFSVLERFYGICNRIFPQLKVTDAKKTNLGIQKALDYLNENFISPVSVEKLANLCCMSQSLFYSRFKKQTGESPICYKNRLRIENACRLLVSEIELPIHEISEKLGFETENHFRKLFKQATNLTPREYREKSPILL